MAPELLDPNRYGRKFARTPATDVYAFGCVCIEVWYTPPSLPPVTIPLQLYTGRPPLSDLPGPAVIFPILNGERAPRPMGLPTMSDTLWQNLNKYWAADPEARPSSEIVIQEMVWPTVDGEDGLVAAGVPTSPFEIAYRRCQYSMKCFSMDDPKEGESLPVEHTVAGASSPCFSHILKLSQVSQARHPEEDVNSTRFMENEESEASTSEARMYSRPE
jgi:serine/threonine protein kinase